MSETLKLILDRVSTPIGEMILVADHDGNLRAVDWTDHEERMLRLLRRQYRGTELVIEPGKSPHGFADAVSRYFAGDLAALDGLPTATSGTAFQREVWRALREIPYGQTVSYAELAKRIGRPAAVRAVGLANGANPIGVIVPCHRVIGANGSLTGYGGGIERKRWLLVHESRAGTLWGKRDES
jgi:methylated-DNA-[protein]-cysteine S-methyltransferase